jgi:DMSO/TMAO reductase YedYZ molybdopterin-dependent catalytic subunit
MLRSPGRQTNQLLLVVLLLVYATGIAALSVGSSSGAWVAIAHGIAGIGVVLLIPWKSRVARAGLRRVQGGKHVSLILAALTLLSLAVGLGSASGLVRTIVGKRGLWLHIAVAFALVPVLVWHVVARRARPRRTDLTRRAVLRAAAVAVGAAALYVADEATIRLLDLPGARRAFTGSYEQASGRPDAMPTTVWLADSVPSIDPAQYRLSVVDGNGQRDLTLAQLSAYDTLMRATLDCTSGWYSDQDWTGVPLSMLLHRTHDAQSVYVHSVSGYWVRYPIDDLDRLLLATRVGRGPLSAGHGFPARIVAPGRRGYWWAKWVDRIELQTTPSWWQPPFPIR